MEAQLPDELLLIIFKDLPQQTLRDARLINSQWNAVSTPLVFERVHASLLSWSLVKLSALSQSPLARHVKAIDFRTEQLCEIQRRSYASFVRESSRRGSSKLTSSDQQESKHRKEANSRDLYTKAQRDEGWKAYETCLKESNSWTGLVDSFLLLNSCLPRFRNLREVVAGRIKRSGTSRIDATAYWNNLERTILVNPFFFSERRGHATALGDGGAPTALLLVALGNRSRVEGVKHLESLTIEMPGHSHLDVIRYRRGFCRHYEHNEGFDDEKAAEAQCQVVLDVFKRLKHLALLFPGSREMSKYELIEYRDSKYETLQLLESATDLESLELEVDEGKRVLADDCKPRDSPVDLVLLSLLSKPETTYLHLRELKIGASLHPDSFINFLSNHKSTLRRLVMTDCISYHWETILDFIDRDLKLDLFRAKFLWTRRLRTRDVDDDRRYIDFPFMHHDEEDDRDWEDFRSDGELEMFQGKVLLFDARLNKKMNLSYEEFEDGFRSAGAFMYMTREMFERASDP